MANELIDSRLESGNKGFILKLDIEKAYDHTSWGFNMMVLVSIEVVDSQLFPKLLPFFPKKKMLISAH